MNRASRFKVTNGEFLGFVRAGGYSNCKFWSSEGWGWKTFRNVKWPTFWIPDGPQGLHRCADSIVCAHTHTKLGGSS